MRVTIHRFLTVTVAATLSWLGAGAVAVPAQAAGFGYVRLAHFSPDTPNVDVYLSSQAGLIPKEKIPGVGYGVLSAYKKLPVGGYTVAMRLSGVDESEPAVLTTQVSVAAGSAYTVAGVGPYAGLGLKVLRDDLKLPGGNKAKVRIVQASVQVPVLAVALENGEVIAQNVAFATTTEYQLVSPGNWQLLIRPASGGNSTNVSARLRSGNVYSLLVLDSGQGTLKTELRTDASRSGGLPDGGIDTGGGGAAGSSIVKYLFIGAGVLLIVVAAGVVLKARRRHSTVL